MATTAQQQLHIINAATKQELKLVKKDGLYQVAGEVIQGDLYRDQQDLHVAILVVSRRMVVEQLPEIVIAPEPNT